MPSEDLDIKPQDLLMVSVAEDLAELKSQLSFIAQEPASEAWVSPSGEAIEWLILCPFKQDVDFDLELPYTPIILMVDLIDFPKDLARALKRSQFYLCFRPQEDRYLLAALNMDVSVLYLKPCLNESFEKLGLSMRECLSFQALAKEIQADHLLKIRARKWVHQKFPNLLSRAQIPTDHVLQTIFQQVNLVAPICWGRSGTLLMHSLLDSHPEVLSMSGFGFTGLMQYYSTLWPTMQNSSPHHLQGLVEVFSTLTTGEIPDDIVGVTPLFAQADQTFNARFKVLCLEILQKYFRILGPNVPGQERKIFLLSAHLAYALCLGESIEHKKWMVVQLHSPENIPNLAEAKKDFPEMKVIGMARDPMRSFYSALANQVQHLSKTTPDFGYCDLIYRGRYIGDYRHLLMGWRLAQKTFQFDLQVIQLEALHERPAEIMGKLAQWLGISWDDVLLESTADGLPFQMRSGIHGQVSARQKTFDPQRVRYDKWREHFTSLDRFVIEGILFEACEKYQLAEVPPFQKYLALVLLFLPNKLEKDAFLSAFERKNKLDLQYAFLTLLERYYYTFLFLFGHDFYSFTQNWSRPVETSSGGEN